MEIKKDRNSRFVSISDKAGVHDSFQIANGGTVFINGKESYVHYIDQCHFMVGMRCYHIFEFFERVVKEAGNIVLPGQGLITHEYGSNYSAYKKGTYSYVVLPDLGDSAFEFSELRIIRETLPLGKYAYDLRHDDEGKGKACQLARSILVNHLGTIISSAPILGIEEKSIYLEKDMYFADQACSIQA